MYDNIILRIRKKVKSLFIILTYRLTELKNKLNSNHNNYLFYYFLYTIEFSK